MTGVTPHGIRYPDGASRAKNLGPELQQMAEDIDGYVDSRIENIVLDENFARAYPESPVTPSGLTSVPLYWVHKTLDDPYPVSYPVTYPGTWKGNTLRQGDVPILTRTGKLATAQVPDWVAAKSDIPDVVPDTAQPRKVIAADLPILGARVARAILQNEPLAVVMTGSSTTANPSGYVGRLLSLVRDVWPLVNQSALQSSPDATFTRRTEPGIHGYNAGQNGATSATYLTDAECDRIAELTPAVIQHMIGSNDYTAQRDPEVYRQDVANRLSYFDSVLTVPTQHVLVHAYARLDFSPALHPHAAYLDALNQIAAARSDTVVLDLSGAYRANGIPGSDPLALIASDQTHQTPTGHRFMADLLSNFYTN